MRLYALHASLRIACVSTHCMRLYALHASKNFMAIEQDELFRKKYRIKSHRWQGWNYADSGVYFITICTKNRVEYFGRTKNEEIILNDVGIIAEQAWLKTEKMRDNVELDEFVVMPNHIHGIIILENNDDVETHRNASLHEEYKNKFGPQINNISSIIRGFKGEVTNNINSHFPNICFAWQPRFYDHVVRSEKELDTIRRYIYYNPVKWAFDENNSNTF